MRKIFIAIMATLILSGSSWADILYTTSSGNLGIINTSSSLDVAPEVKFSGLGSNSLVAPYWAGSETKIIAIDRTTDTTTSGDSAYIFTPSLSKIREDSITLDGVYNAQSVASAWNGRSIFFASRENASILSFATSNFALEKSYTFEPDSQDIYTPYMTGAISGYYGVYCLVDCEDAGSSVLMFDGQLKDGVQGFSQVDFDDTIWAMAWLSNSRIAVGMSDGVEVIVSSRITKLVSTDHPVKAVCRDSSNGFYYVTQEESGDEYIHTISHQSGSTNRTLRVMTAGETCKLVSETKTHTLAAIIGEKIYIYDTATEDLRAEYDSADLGGVPVSISLNSASGDDYDSARSSCNVSFAGIALLLACATFLIKK